MLLESLYAERRWENEPAEGWAVPDLDATVIVRTVEDAVRRGRAEDPATRDPAELLRGLGLIRDGTLLPAAVVLFGREDALELRTPQCLLRVGRFRGTDRTEFIENRQFHGNVFRLLQLAERFLRESLPVAGRVLPGLFERVDDPLYPLLALREALANAICHRYYSIGGASVAVAIYLATPGKLSISVGTPPSPNFTLGGVAGAVVLSGADVWDIAIPSFGTWAKPPADGFSKSQLAAAMGNLAAAEAGEVGGTTWGKPLLENSIAIREWAFSQAGTITDKVLLHAATITSFVMSFRKFSKQVDAGTSKWKNWDGGSLAIAAAAEVLKLY